MQFDDPVQEGVDGNCMQFPSGAGAGQLRFMIMGSW
jgi:hypothetical protein